MNKKAELFKSFLDDNKIEVFQVQEIPEDQLNTVVFRSNIEAEGQQLPTLIILDDSIYGIIRVRVANQVVKDGNEAEVMKAINKLNSQYKVFKYYVAEDGALMLDAVVLSRPEEIDGNMIYTVLDVIVKHIVPEYKNIMKLVWA